MGIMLYNNTEKLRQSPALYLRKAQAFVPESIATNESLKTSRLPSLEHDRECRM